MSRRRDVSRDIYQDAEAMFRQSSANVRYWSKMRLLIACAGGSPGGPALIRCRRCRDAGQDGGESRHHRRAVHGQINASKAGGGLCGFNVAMYAGLGGCTRTKAVIDELRTLSAVACSR